MNRWIPVLLVIMFAGSVFAASGKFVDAQNAPKFYFTVIFILILGLFIGFYPKTFAGLPILRYHNGLFLGIFAICFMQTLLGLAQYVGLLHSNHSRFAITGSFDNPAGFAAVLALGFPTGLYLLSMAKKIERYFVAIGLVVIAITIFLSGSRTGVLAILISSFSFFLFQKSIIGKFQNLWYYRLLIVLGVTFILAVSFALYHQKKHSANGRLLIWKVSSEMIKDKPVFGHGADTFKAKYMDYQADYFKNNPNSRFELIADNVRHPFNEFIKIAVEYGLTGLGITLLFTLFVLWKTLKSTSVHRGFVLSGLASFLVFASFSYPLQYTAVWLLVGFYLFALVPSKEIRIKYKRYYYSIITRIVVVGACAISLFHFTRQIQAEIKWKTIAINSLRGNTEEMLPKYEKLYSTSLKQNPFFLYNYGAELNVAGKFDKSLVILAECMKHFNDYDLQMLLADNYYNTGDAEKAIRTYQHASNMIPGRFLPLHKIFEIYRDKGKKEMALKYAKKIVNKKVKIPSITVESIISDAEIYLQEFDNRTGKCEAAPKYHAPQNKAAQL